VRTRKGISTRTGLEWTINPTTFGPTLLSRKYWEDEDLVSFNFDNNRAFTFNNFRLNDGNDNIMTLNFHLTSSRTSMIKGIN
jgi:hypothetical protein